MVETRRTDLEIERSARARRRRLREVIERECLREEAQFPGVARDKRVLAEIRAEREHGRRVIASLVYELEPYEGEGSAFYIVQAPRSGAALSVAECDHCHATPTRRIDLEVFLTDGSSVETHRMLCTGCELEVLEHAAAESS